MIGETLMQFAESKPYELYTILGIVLLSITEIIYIYIINEEKKRKGGLFGYTLSRKLYSLASALVIIYLTWFIILAIEAIINNLKIVLIALGVIFLVVIYFGINYLMAKFGTEEEKAKSPFKIGDKLIVIDDDNQTKIHNGDIVTCKRKAYFSHNDVVIDVENKGRLVRHKRIERFKKYKKR